MENLVIVKQLPVIEQHLQNLSKEIKEKVDLAMKLVCTEDTVKDVKSVRAELNKQFKELEESRGQVKKAVLAPYEEFEGVYKECVTELFKKADADLKAKIDDVEGSIKAERQKEIEDYFAELAAANDIDFLTFKVSNINVTLSASTKSLKEQAKSFVERIAADLETIETQEHKDEILVEYKACLDLSKSITTVANRKKALQEQEERRKAAEEARNKALEEVKPIDKAEAPLQAPKEVKAEAKVKMTFTVRGTMQELKTLKDFLEKGGYDYE